MDPTAPREEIYMLRESTRVNNLVLSYLISHGLHFLATSSFDAICSSLKSNANDAVINIVLNGESCYSLNKPDRDSPYSSIKIALLEREVQIEAWITNQER
jgi:hypothetical protein